MEKIVIIHSALGFGGSIISLVDLISMLDKEYEVHIVLSKKVSDKVTNYLADYSSNILYYDKDPLIYAYYSGIKFPFAIGFWRALFNFKNNLYWINLIEQINPDIVLLNSSVLSPMVKVLQNSRRKFIVFNRETSKKRFCGIMHYIMTRFLRSSDMVLFLSKYELQQFMLHLSKVEVISDVVRSSSESTQSVKHQKGKHTNLLFLGGISKLKGTHILLKAVSKLPASSWSLTILGDIESMAHKGYFSKKYYKKCVGMIKKLSNIKLIGQVYNVNDYYSNCDIVIFPSTHPHQSRPIYEAGFMRKPIIISDFAETSEYLVNEHNGLAIKPMSYKELKKSIEYCLNNKVKVEQMGYNNYQMSLKYHSFSKEKHKLLSLINNMLKERESDF